MLRGVVKNYSSEKGFGFIKPNDGSSDVFVHATTVKLVGVEELRAGETVEFEAGPGKNGKPRATSVRLVG